MSSINDLLLDIEQEQNESNVDGNYPEGISDKNASGSAYKAMNQIKQKKLSFIRANRNWHARLPKKKYTLSQTEVCNLVDGVKQPNTLFKSSAYSEALLEHYEKINSELLLAKNNRIEELERKKNTGLKNKQKSDLVNIVRTDKDRISELEQKLAEEQLTLAINKMSIDVRRKIFAGAFD